MDYVKIGDYEGQVEEITINYTKLYTPTFNMLQIPNVQVLNSRILNATHEEMIKDTFQFSFPHSIPLSNEEIMNKCIKPSFNEIETKYRECVVRSPEVYFDNSTSFARTYMIRLFIQRGKAKDLYIIKSELSNHIMNHWDLERRKLG
jgi:small-conductance mechanosensitive channel